MNEINAKLLDNSNVYKVGFDEGQDVRTLVEWDDIRDKPESYPPSPHTHEASDVYIDNSDLENIQSDNVQGAVEDIDTALSDIKTNKADISDIPLNLSDLNEDSSHRTVSDVEKGAWDAKSDFSGDFNDLTGKPETYPPSGHTHTGNQVEVNTSEMYYVDGSNIQEVFENLDFDIVELYNYSAKKQDKKDKVNDIDKYLAYQDWLAQEYYPSIIGVRDYVAKQKQGLYVRPEAGIPKSDMATSVQESLDKADRSIQSLKGYATESYVNSSIATNTAYFRGKYNSIEGLRSYLGPKTLNDYAFVVVYESGSTTQVKQYDRYKWNGSSWVFEYTLNNSSFTDSQWKSINSGIDVFDVETFRNYEYTKANTNDIPTYLNQLIDDTNHRTVTDSEKALWNNKGGFSGSYNDLTDKPDAFPSTGELVSVDTDDTTFLTATNVQELAVEIDESLDTIYFSLGGKELVTNKINSFNDPSLITNIKYPSAFAVKSYVDQSVTSKYEMPTGGIPKTDLASAVQESLEKADSSIQSLDGYATEDFVNSSIATNTAYFRGTFNSVAELNAYSGAKTPNDYAFVIVYDSVVTTQVKQYDRYKWDGTTWAFEYTLNNSSFTQNQWNAINSGITNAKRQQYDAYALTKQDAITDLDDIRNNIASNQDNITSLGEAFETAEENIGASIEAISGNVLMLTDAVNDKVDKVSGKGLSTNDFTTSLKNRLNTLTDAYISGLIDAKLGVIENGSY